MPVSTSDTLIRSDSCGGHLLLFHTSEQERESGLAQWVRHGLAHNEQTLVVDSVANRAHRPLTQALAEHGVDGESAIRQGRLRTGASAQIAVPDRWPELVRSAAWPAASPVSGSSKTSAP
jgi:hypothetical protein